MRADQEQHDKDGVDTAEVLPTASPEQPNLGPWPVGTGRARPASHRLPQPPPITVPVCERTRIERIRLTDGDSPLRCAGGEGEQEYEVVLHTVPPPVDGGSGPAEQVAVSTTDMSAEHRDPTVDDDTGVVRSVN